MASRAPFSNLDPAMEAEARRRGCDPHKLDQSMEQMMLATYDNLPDFPIYPTARLTARRTAPSDGLDRISLLSDELLRDIVSRLPVKDAARTAVLAPRWRGVWRSTPLVLIDAHLFDVWPPARANTPAVTAAVTCALTTHPGPFRCVHLVSSCMDAYQDQLKRWLRLLAAKGVQELVLVNRPWPREVPLPKTIFTIATLTRLYIGLWKFPDTTGLRGASFPHLRELGICSVATEDGDIDSIVARSPVLEILNIHGSFSGVRLRLVSRSLRCVQICYSVMESIAVVNAPSLERLILSGTFNQYSTSLCTRIKIGNAPKLSLLGYLEPGKHVLEIRDTVIMAGIEASASIMLTTVKVLSLDLCFGDNDAKMVPDFLRCFPNVEALHITSRKCDQSTSKLNLKFWEEVGPIVSVMFRIKVMTLREFQGKRDELAFLQFFFESARVLEFVVVMMANPRFTSRSVDEMSSSLQNMSDEKWASKFEFVIFGSKGPEGGKLWTFQQGANFNDDDPFASVKIIRRGPSTHQQRSQAGGNKRRN